MASAYLAREAARGCEYCFDPDSDLLRQALRTAPPEDGTALEQDAVLEDLVFLRRLLQKVYAGYPDLLQQPTFDPDGFFIDWERRVRRAAAVGTAGSVSTVSFGDAFLESLATLRGVLPDRHLVVGSEASLLSNGRFVFHEYQAALPAGVEPPELEGVGPEAISITGADGIKEGVQVQTLRTAPLWRADGGVALTVSVSAAAPAGSAESLMMRWSGGELHLRRRAETPAPQVRPPRVPAYEWRKEGDTAMVTLRRFGGGVTVRGELDRFVADYAAHAQSRQIVFDLRGNNGGSLEYIHRWISQARRGPWRTYPRLEVVGALWPCSEWNAMVERQVREGRVDTVEAREERERVQTEWPTQRPAHASWLDDGLREERAEAPYGGKVLVLVDQNSGSSGELAAVQLKRALGAVVLGERTAGAMQYGELRQFVLPRTGLVCQVPTKRFFFQHEVELVGWPTDVYLENAGQDVSGAAIGGSAYSEVQRALDRWGWPV
jgi:hypothetical protein